MFAESSRNQKQKNSSKKKYISNYGCIPANTWLSSLVLVLLKIDDTNH